MPKCEWNKAEDSILRMELANMVQQEIVKTLSE